MASVSLDQLQGAVSADTQKKRRTFVEALEQAPNQFLLLFTAIYALAECCSNLRRAFWFDELISYYLADLPSIHQIWPLIARGIELNPPLPFWITWVVHHTIGRGEVITRLPAIAGFWLMCVCLHYFVRRRSDAVHGFVAMLLPLFTYTSTEATWARGYGLMLGSSAAALLCWQLAADRVSRKLALTGLSASVATAVSCHYYALYVAGALTVGELIRLADRKRIDYPVWLALAAGVSPLLAYTSLLPILSSASHTFWITPMFRFFYESYADLLGPITIVLLLGLALVTRLDGRPETPRWKQPSLKRHEVATCLMLMAMPLAIYIAGMVSPLPFYSRYVQPVVIGFSITVTMFAYRIGGGSREFRSLMICLVIGLCFVPWALFQVLKPLILPKPGTAIQAWIDLPRESDLQVVVDNENDYLTLFHYAPADIRARIYFMCEPAAAVRYVGSNTGLRSLELLQSFHDVHLVDYRKFTSDHREFLIERSHSGSAMIQKLLEDGGNLRLVRLQREHGAFVDDRLLFRVTMPEIR